jgi:hypothetical protein
MYSKWEGTQPDKHTLMFWIITMQFMKFLFINLKLSLVCSVYQIIRPIILNDIISNSQHFLNLQI